MRNIKHLLDVVDQVRDHVALGLMSDPGLSKTAQVKQWAEENGRTYCELIISQRMPSEISGMPMPVADSQTMEVFDFQTLLNLKDGDVLAFDEFTNGNIQTLNACLTLIQERTMLSGKKLPSLVIVAMGNPQGRCELLPQTKQRFWWVTVGWDAPTWKRYMRDRWQITVSEIVVKAITQQYQIGFAASGEYNYFTPRTVENLFRIAQKIPKTAQFWSVSDLNQSFIHALYDSLENRTTFAQVNKKLEAWCLHQAETIDHLDDSSTFEFFQKLLLCGSMEELKNFILLAEDDSDYDDILPVFKEFLDTTDLGEKQSDE